MPTLGLTRTASDASLEDRAAQAKALKTTTSASGVDATNTPLAAASPPRPEQTTARYEQQPMQTDPKGALKEAPMPMIILPAQANQEPTPKENLNQLLFRFKEGDLSSDDFNNELWALLKSQDQGSDEHINLLKDTFALLRNEIRFDSRCAPLFDALRTVSLELGKQDEEGFALTPAELSRIDSEIKLNQSTWNSRILSSCSNHLHSIEINIGNKLVNLNFGTAFCNTINFQKQEFDATYLTLKTRVSQLIELLNQREEFHPKESHDLISLHQNHFEGDTRHYSDADMGHYHELGQPFAEWHDEKRNDDTMIYHLHLEYMGPKPIHSGQLETLLKGLSLIKLGDKPLIQDREVNAILDNTTCEACPKDYKAPDLSSFEDDTESDQRSERLNQRTKDHDYSVMLCVSNTTYNQQQKDAGQRSFVNSSVAHQGLRPANTKLEECFCINARTFQSEAKRQLTMQDTMREKTSSAS